MEVKFEKAFLQAVKKHAGIKKQIEAKVKQIVEHPVKMGEPLKGNLRGFYSCPEKKTSSLSICIAMHAAKKGMMNLLPVSTAGVMPTKH